MASKGEGQGGTAAEAWQELHISLTPQGALEQTLLSQGPVISVSWVNQSWAEAQGVCVLGGNLVWKGSNFPNKMAEVRTWSL